MKEDGMALDVQAVLENLAANAEARELVEESLAIAGFADGTIDHVLAWARQNGRAARERHDDPNAPMIPIPASMIEKANRHGD